MSMRSMRQGSVGFTLIEVMIVVAIIGILSAIAIPSYQNYMRESRRVEGQNLLLEIASKQARFNTENYTFADKVGALGYGAAANTKQLSPGGFYEITISAANATSYTLTATAKKDQINDHCGNLTLDNLGTKGKTGAGSLSSCWK